MLSVPVCKRVWEREDGRLRARDGKEKMLNKEKNKNQEMDFRLEPREFS